MASYSFLLNDREVSVPRTAGTVLLDVLRDDFGLTGTKEGCREGDCGACMVLLGVPGPDGIVYRTVNSCLFPLGDAAGRHIVTIEGLNGADLSPVQRALVDGGAIQCGFCTPGLVVALTGFLLSCATVSEADGVAALGSNICRCTGYASIRRAIGRLCSQFRDLEPSEGASSAARVAALVARGILPRHFLDAPARLRGLSGKSPAPAVGAGSRVAVAGGTDLFVTRAGELREAGLDLLSRRDDIRGIRTEAGRCRIGAATTLTEVESSPAVRRAFPELGACLARIASLPIRNRATIAGNIVNASPAGDLSVIFLALGADLILSRGSERRTVRLRDFFLGYKVLDLKPGELVAEIDFPLLQPGDRFHFEKVGRREFLDISGVSSAIRLRLADDRIVEAHVSAGSVAPVPLYLRKTSELLRGKGVSTETAREAAAAAEGEILPIDDVRGSAAYRKALLPRLVLAHFLGLFPERVREEDIA